MVELRIPEEASYFAAIKAASQQGFFELGSGNFATVLSHPEAEHRAWKIARSDGWPRYILWAIENGYAGNFAPKLYNIQSFSGFGYYIGEMERLKCTIMESNDNKALLMYREFQHATERFRPWSRHVRDDYIQTNFHPEIKAFGDKLERAGLANDISARNCMIRNDGSFVVTDPDHHLPKDISLTITRLRQLLTAGPEPVQACEPYPPYLSGIPEPKPRKVML